MGISTAGIRAVRAALFTALVVTLSAASHVLLAGAPLPPTTLAVVAAAVFALTWALAGRERSFGRIAALFVPLELAADTVFTTGRHVCYGPSGGPVTGSLRSVGLDVLCGGDPVGAGVPLHAPAPDPAAPLALLAAHVGLGLLAAAWLRGGERALVRLLRAGAAFAFRPLRAALLAAGAAPAPAAGTALPRAVHRARILRTALLVHSVGLRGPPRATETPV
ncbi:hypothetical protein [Streptomyces sp. NPDC060194]|uniref:hypothetical protein n=1 Tax=Streptomyces sp. NPDC060194 TaxID=3347069 RepID=UPI00365F9191